MSIASRLLLRYALCALFFWFGIQQLIDPGAWTVFLPEWTGYIPAPAEMLVRLNGWLEVMLALALLIGVFTRVAAALLGLHLLGVAWWVGGAIGVRDAILGLCAISLALSAPDTWTLDARRK